LVGEDRDQLVAQTLSPGRAVEVYQDRVPGRSFDKRADGGTVECPNDQVAFPVPRHGAVVCFGGSLVDHRQWDNEPAASLIASPASSTVAAVGPQNGLGVTLQDLVGAVERLVDGLHRDRTAVLVTQYVGDLFGAPTLIEVMLYQLAQLTVELEVPPFGTCPPGEHHRLGLVWPVVTIGRPVPCQLAAHRRDRPAQLGGD